MRPNNNVSSEQYVTLTRRGWSLIFITSNEQRTNLYTKQPAQDQSLLQETPGNDSASADACYNNFLI